MTRPSSGHEAGSVPGTLGYEDDVACTVAALDAIDPAVHHQHICHLFPDRPARILDIGAGTGRDALAFARLGHHVTAVEPATGLRQACQPHKRITWSATSLPALEGLRTSTFDYVQALAVWHHLSPDEQARAMARLAAFLAPDAVLTLSLRHGPAGLGRHVYPTDAQAAVRQANAAGLATVLRRLDQPSAMPGKPQVRWDWLAFRRRA